MDVVLTIEKEPILIGGLEGLMARVTYDEMARRLGIEGMAYVQFVVMEDGSVTEVKVVRDNFDQSFPSFEDLSPAARATRRAAYEDRAQALRRSAVYAVETSRFEPGLQRGRPVRVRYTLPLRFVLR